MRPLKKTDRYSWKSACPYIYFPQSHLKYLFILIKFKVPTMWHRNRRKVEVDTVLFVCNFLCQYSRGVRGLSSFLLFFCNPVFPLFVVLPSSFHRSILLLCVCAVFGQKKSYFINARENERAYKWNAFVPTPTQDIAHTNRQADRQTICNHGTFCVCWFFSLVGLCSMSRFCVVALLLKLVVSI